MFLPSGIAPFVAPEQLRPPPAVLLRAGQAGNPGKRTPVAQLWPRGSRKELGVPGERLPATERTQGAISPP